MIKNILLPEKIGNYFIFPKRIIGFFLGKNIIKATQLNVSGSRKTIVEKYFEEHLEIGSNLSRAIEKIIQKTDKYDGIKVSLPGSLVIFKELTLPFTDLDKIRMVLDFEVEAALPFSIDEAVVDFIVIKKDLLKKESTILACVARKKDIYELIDTFKNAGLQITNVGVDVIDIYGLYKSIYALNTGTDIILDIEFAYTNVIYVQNGELRLARTIHQGISTIAKSISEHMKIDNNKALEYLIRFGLEISEDQEYNRAVNNAMSEFIGSIQFTLNSFKSLYSSFSEITRIIVTGNEIKKFSEFLETKLNIKSEYLNTTKILQNNNITFKEKHFPNSGIISLAAALPVPQTEEFNLLRKDLEPKDINLLNKQIIAFIALFILAFAPLLGYSYFQKSKLETEVNNSKKEVIAILKNEFEITDPKILKNLTEVIQTAKSKLDEEKNIWYAFSPQTRLSFLKYLNELSEIIDKDAIGLKLKKLTIFTTAPDVITLDGEVRDFAALGILEKELDESKLFSHVSAPQETKFNIDITTKKNEELE
ncbi:MAG: pilus assembly protein PilM [Candidatus Babeliales bacterium]|nr:pilus assembly protein PilM [Candidatus Babeliales bacterium]